MGCCWAPPCFEPVSHLRLPAAVWTPVVEVRAVGLFHSAEVHITTNGTQLDGALVRLYAIIGNAKSLLSESVIGAATLAEEIADGQPVPAVAARRGIIASASGILAQAFAVEIFSTPLVTSGGTLTLTGWGQ